jgi:3(or 17)beta-hydroxysteroid dehydrogenase
VVISLKEKVNMGGEMVKQESRNHIGRLERKVAIVTGSAEGIGAATAKLFAREGAKVVVADINEAKGQQVAEEIRQDGGEAIFILVDVTNEDNWKSLMETTVKKFGKLNILVNNAGISKIADIESTTLDDWNALMAVNATGVFLGTKHAILTMKKNGELCSIVNRSSIDGQVAEPDLFAYCASKGAVTILTKSAALSCGAGEYTIRVNSVHPGYVHTSMTKGEAQGYGIREDEYVERMKDIHPIGIGKPIDVAYMDLFLASDESKWVTGAEFTIDGGVTAQ